MTPIYRGLFLAEGSSDEPLAAIVEGLFLTHGREVQLSIPDFGLVASRVDKDVESRVRVGLALLEQDADVVVVHRDSDNAGAVRRRAEIEAAMLKVGRTTALVPVIPVRMTEAWLLVDEQAIRTVAGNPRGRMPLNLPSAREIERVADPKALLKECLATASATTGHRREEFHKRFSQRRRQLLERLDPNGPVTRLAGWQDLLRSVHDVAAHWS